MKSIHIAGFAVFVSLTASGLAFAQCADWALQTTPTNQITYNCTTGKVGIGTGTPPAKLTVSGGVVAVSGGTQSDPNGYPYANDEVTQLGYDLVAHAGFLQAAKWGTGWEPLLLNPSAGNVGVGTSAPAVPLDVQVLDPGTGVPTTLLRLATRTGSVYGSGAAMELAALNNNGTLMPIGKIAVSLTNGAVGQQGGDLILSVSNNGTLSPRIQMIANGGVNIGNSSVPASVNVTGSITATGSITGAQVLGATYQDVAEWVPAAASLEAGTVVVLNPEHDNQVKASAEAYDTRVAGVVSASPGVILGVGAAGKEKIATTGRVPVRVDATRAPIAIGDLLVTSDVAGTAMKSQPIDVGGAKIHRPGTVIGKALQPLSNGRGEILVLLSLQ